jgi:hypothetical protein
MRYYDEPEKIQNEGHMEEIPNHIPVFKEKSNMVDLSYSYKEYKKKLAKDWPSYNPVAKLGYYKEKPTEEMYNDDPSQEADFKTPNMGIFNDPDYCHIHDHFILTNPEVILDKMYFFSDYHPLSIPRYFAWGEAGLDTNPKVSKNMKLVNWYQRLFAMDPRTSVFYTKKAAFHTFHEIGSHFACWGQSYNHIPGHGGFIRKDLLVTSANNYLKKWNRFAVEASKMEAGEPRSETSILPLGTTKANVQKCFNETSVFPVSYRLYDKEECERYFEIMASEQYAKDKQESEV